MDEQTTTETIENPYAEFTAEQLDAHYAERKAAFDALTAIAKPTLAKVKEAERLATELEEIKAAQASFAQLSSLPEKFADKPDPEPEPAEELAGKEKAEEPEEERGVARDVEEPQTETPDVVPQGHVAPDDGDSDAPELQHGSTVETLAARTSRPEIPAERRRGNVRVNAASGLDTFAAGESMDDGLLGVAKGAIERVKSFPSWRTPDAAMADKGPQINKFGTAAIDLGIPEDFMVDDGRMTPEMVDEVLNRAADETQLPGKSLVAAGGWCAPSEVLMDLTQDATTEGLLSHPEVGIARAGLKWPVSPVFADFYASPGFKYTETQAIAGQYNNGVLGGKPCITIPCPTFDEARLSVEGLCVMIDILQNTAWPETVRNYVDGTMVAHAHWMNATKIGAMVTLAGAARVITGMGSSVDDTLAAFELVANQTRQKYRLRFNQTLEVVLPFWVKDMFKADLRRRREDGAPVTDQQLNALFAATKCNVQYVYDWQDIDITAEVYPATFNALMYPAGTFIFGTKPIINVSTVYDAASLAQNTYTGLFTEQGWLVAKRKFHADLLTLPIANAGQLGAKNETTGAGKL